MIWSKSRFQHSIELLPRVLKEVAPLLFPLSLILWGLEFYVSYLNKSRFDDPYGSSMLLIVIAGLGGVILQGLTSVMAILYVGRSTQRQMKNGTGPHPAHFLKSHFHQTFIEYMRSVISIGIHSIFLVIPGVIRWVKLTFVCLISAFDPDYQEGHMDALHESSRLTRGAWIPLLLLLLCQVALPMMLQELGKAVFVPFVGSLFLYCISWILTLYLQIYLVLTFFARWSFKKEKTIS